VLVGLKGLVDPEVERARIERELKKIDRELAAMEIKLRAPGFVDRAPPEVVDETKAQRGALMEARVRLEAARELAQEL
jgi:valyl-tRNA synthetase